MTYATARERIEQERAAREAADFAAYNAWRAAQEAARLQKLADDLEALGVGGSVDITDNLLSNSVVSVLSANQGRVLKELIDSLDAAAVGADIVGSAYDAYLDAKDYADSLVVGLWNDRGVFDASGGVYPAAGGSGVAGAIKKGDIWTVSVAGTLPTGRVVEVGDVVRALINAAANTSADWAIVQNNIGYVTENSVNKASNLLTPDNTKYPTTLAIVNALLDYQTVANNRYTFNNQTGTTYTVVAADVTTNGKVILKCTNAAAITVTLGTPASLGASVGDSFNVRQGGAGGITISGAVTGSTITAETYTTLTLIAETSTTWMCVGG